MGVRIWEKRSKYLLYDSMFLDIMAIDWVITKVEIVARTLNIYDYGNRKKQYRYMFMHVESKCYQTLKVIKLESGKNVRGFGT